MIKGVKISLIVAGVVVILTVIMLATVLKGYKRENDSYKGTITAMDSVIKLQNQRINDLEIQNKKLDEKIAEFDKAIEMNRKKETIIINRYEKIPVDIHALDREQLRREVANF